MSKPLQLQNCPQCTATSKRTKNRCKGPAMKGWNVCRFHGARGGAPRGVANGNFKHGAHTEEAKLSRSHLSALLKDAKATCLAAQVVHKTEIDQ